MAHSKHLALAAPTCDSVLGPVSDRAAPQADKDDRCRRGEPSATESGSAGLEKELLMLRKRCRARELALASMAGAVGTLRHANRALSDENTLLRQQVSELRERSSADRRSTDVRGRGSLVVTDG